MKKFNKLKKNSGDEGSICANCKGTRFFTGFYAFIEISTENFSHDFEVKKLHLLYVSPDG